MMSSIMKKGDDDASLDDDAVVFLNYLLIMAWSFNKASRMFPSFVLYLFFPFLRATVFYSSIFSYLHLINNIYMIICG
jgi:hypothetical protein